MRQLGGQLRGPGTPVISSAFQQPEPSEASNDDLREIENFGIGAVRFGWLGLFIGIIIMSASNIIISLDNIGQALAVALLTPFYGYFIQIITNISRLLLTDDLYDSNLT